MYTIDTHTHIIPKHIPDFSKKFGYGDFITLNHHQPGRAWMMQGDTRFREIVENCWDAEVRIREMKEHGANMQVICTIPVMFSYWAKSKDALEVSQFLNDDIAATCHAHPEHFVGLATVPMQDSKLAVKELERCMKNGFKGVQIGSNINNLNLNEAQFDEFFAACDALGAAILVHPWQMMGQEHMGKYWLPWLVGMPAEISRAACSMIFGGVFDKYPKLRVMFAHAGGSFPFTLGRIAHGWAVRPDLANLNDVRNPKDYIGKFWVDGITHDTKSFDYLLDLFGADKICYGTDYPFPLGDLEHGKFIEENMNISADDKNKIFSESIKSFLKIN